MKKSKKFKWIFLAIIFALIFVGILFYKFIIPYLIVAFILSYLIGPIINFAEKYQISRTLSILIVYLISAILIVLLFYVIVPQIIEQITDFAGTFKTVFEKQETVNLQSFGLERISEFITKLDLKFPFLKIDKFISSQGEKLLNLIKQLPQILMKSISGIVNFLAFLIVVPVIGFFILRDERKFLKSFFSIIPNRYFEFLLHLFESIEENFGKFFRALLLETGIVAVLSILGLLILGIPYALILGIIVGLSNPIKYFGPFIGAIPTMFVILVGQTPDIFMLYVVIIFFVIQQIDSLILFPWLIGKSMKMHPLFVLLTVIAGGYAFGILGMLFAVPIVFLVKTIFEVSYKSLREFEII